MSNHSLKEVASSWRESLKLFLPKNLSLFFLVTLNATIKALQVFCKQWGALVAGVFLVQLIIAYVLPTMKSQELSVFWLFNALLLFVLCVRSSSAQKNYSYFVSYTLFIPIIVFYYILVRFKEAYVDFFPLSLLMSPFFITTLFFLFDDSPSVKNALLALFRSFKMTVYNFPFYVVSYTFFLMIRWTSNWLVGLFYKFVMNFSLAYWVGSVFLFLTAFVGYAFYITWFNSFYIKRVHDQYSLYE